MSTKDKSSFSQKPAIIKLRFVNLSLFYESRRKVFITAWSPVGCDMTTLYKIDSKSKLPSPTSLCYPPENLVIAVNLVLIC